MHSTGCRTGWRGSATSAEIADRTSPVAQPARRSQQLTSPGACAPHYGSPGDRSQPAVELPVDLPPSGCAQSPAPHQHVSGTPYVGSRTAAMGEVKARVVQSANVAFFQQAWDKAITTRLSFAQRESNNSQALEYELPNLWEAVQKSYQRKAWEFVVAFQDALRPFLDRRGHWSQSLTLNGWACEGAQASTDEISVVRFTHDRADILQQQGKYHEAEGLYQRCEAGYHALGEHTMAIKSRHMRWEPASYGNHATATGRSSAIREKL